MPKLPRRAGFALLAIACGVYFTLAAFLLISCTNGGALPAGPQRYDWPLPPFTAYSSDLNDAHEGTIGDPLKVAANPRCGLDPVVDFQKPLCEGTVPDVWMASNHVATTNDWHRWRAVVNVEPAWDTACLSGPPNQSLPLGIAPIAWDPQASSVDYGFELPNEAAWCSKIPYVAATYIRGVQGDPMPRLAAWGAQPILTFYTHVDRTVGPTFAQAVYWWAHWRTADGARWMPHFTLWDSGYLPPDFSYRWNWPEINSYYFPGARLHGGTPCGGVDQVTMPGDVIRWTVDVEALTRCRFPELGAMKPDFLGFELATEGAYLDYVHPTGLANRLKLTLSSPSLTLLR